MNEKIVDSVSSEFNALFQVNSMQVTPFHVMQLFPILPLFVLFLTFKFLPVPQTKHYFITDTYLQISSQILREKKKTHSPLLAAELHHTDMALMFKRETERKMEGERET